MFAMTVLTRSCAKQLRLVSVLKDAPFPVLCVRESSTSVPKPEPLCRNISIRHADHSAIPRNERPAVLLYEWLLAKSRHSQRYDRFYLSKGFDVIHIKIEPFQLVWPLSSQSVVKRLVDLLAGPSHQNKPLVSHGFSVGGYMYAETLVRILDDPFLRDHIGGRIQAQVFDSPVAVTGIAGSFPQAVTSNLILQKSFQAFLTGYLRLFPDMVHKHFQKASVVFHENLLEIPSLYLYSRDDPVAIPRPVDEVIASWSARGIPVWHKCWQKSKHVSHYHYHPVDYATALNQFLHDTGVYRCEEFEKQGMDERELSQQAMSGLSI